MLADSIEAIQNKIPEHVTLIAVSKTVPIPLIQEAYDFGLRHFGENKVQEMAEKQILLPNDIKWHLIGHLQSNKVKYIAPYVHLIHSVDSLKLLQEINKQAIKNNRKIDCLLQFHIAKEETKFGFDLSEVQLILESPMFRELKNIQICGVMGMASFTDDTNIVRTEFKQLRKIFDFLKKDYFNNQDSFRTISMGMSGDYLTAIEEGSNMVRIGSSIFGAR